MNNIWLALLDGLTFLTSRVLTATEPAHYVELKTADKKTSVSLREHSGSVEIWMGTHRIQAICINTEKNCYENTYSSGIWRLVVWYIGTKVSEEPATFIFRIKEYIYPEDRVIKFLRNVGSYLLNDMASYPRCSNLNFILGAGWEPDTAFTL
jgi:hypothetical protein